MELITVIELNPDLLQTRIYRGPQMGVWYDMWTIKPRFTADPDYRSCFFNSSINLSFPDLVLQREVIYIKRNIRIFIIEELFKKQNGESWDFSG